MQAAFAPGLLHYFRLGLVLRQEVFVKKIKHLSSDYFEKLAAGFTDAIITGRKKLMLNIDIKASELIALLIVFLYAFFPLIPDIFRALKKKAGRFFLSG